MTSKTNQNLDVDICVIGAGAAGLSVAAGAAQLGAETVLIERGVMGGDCLNTGCVPSKAMLAAGHAAEVIRTAGRFGVAAGKPKVDFAAVNAHVHDVIAGIAPIDSVERFRGLGVNVIQGTACFTDKRTLAVETDTGSRTVTAKRFVVATGSHPVAPPVPGLDSVDYLTNESVFELKECPEHLIILGGGPIGCELAQAHRRLGAKVTIVEMFSILSKDDPEAVDVVRRRLSDEGVAILENAKDGKVEKAGKKIKFTVTIDGETQTVTGTHLLVAAGRAPVVDGLDLDKAGVEVSKKGISVDAGLRTTNKKIFAIGDVAGGPQFTHVAGYQAGILIRRLLFRMFWAKVNYDALPWVTYTDPELAQVGMTEAMAKEQHSKLTILRWGFAENDRAQAERETGGHMKIVATKKGKILGATIVGAGAGELIHPWILAIENGLSLAKMSGYIAPYPTMGEIGKRTASSYYVSKLFSPRTRKIVRWLLKLP